MLADLVCLLEVIRALMIAPCLSTMKSDLTVVHLGTSNTFVLFFPMEIILQVHGKNVQATPVKNPGYATGNKILN